MESESFSAMNTFMTVKSYGRKAAAANQQVKKEIQRLETILSTTIEGSDIYGLNTTGPNSANLNVLSETEKFTEFTVHSETAFLINKSLKFYEITEGAFNPALYPVICEWGFTGEKYKIPETERIRELLKFTDFSRLSLTNNNSNQKYTVQYPAGLQLDFGAIGKGYAGDVAIEILQAAGIKSALLDFGGNIQVLGCKPDGSNWTVGIKNPWGGNPVAAVKLRDSCMITSGGYERFFTGKDGKKYIHIFDGKTGRPVENELESVTIICREGLYGDALSTALFVMGLDKAVDFWQCGARDFDFVIITKDKGIVYSAPLEKNISLLFDFNSVLMVE